MAWTAADIEAKIRLTTGRPDANMMTSAEIYDRMNKFYQFVLPKELKIFWGYTYYQFFTQPNVDQYAGPTSSFQTINPQVWCDGFPIEWYISPDLFYDDWPQQENKAVVATGDGVTTAFAFNIPAFPIIPGSLYVTDGTQVAQDNGTGGFISPATGSINYSTGAVSVTFAVAPALNANITETSQTFMPNRPQAILYYKSKPLINASATERDNQNYFVLRPVPDNVYLVKMQGIQIPPPFVLSTDVPFREDLGPLIAYGTSLEIFADYNQMDQYDQIMPQYNRYKDVSMQDTYEEYLYQRSVSAF